MLAVSAGKKTLQNCPSRRPPSTKADYWIPIRPGTDAALFLGITRRLMEKKQYDAEFVKGFTDFPLLVRTDNLKRLRAGRVFRAHPRKPLLEPLNMRRYPVLKLHAPLFAERILCNKFFRFSNPAFREPLFGFRAQL